MELAELDHNTIAKLSQQQFQAVMSQVLTAWEQDRKENSIYHYVPVSDAARQIHTSKAQTVGVGGGNRSSKTVSCIAEMVMCCTGIIPESLRAPTEEEYEKIRDDRWSEPQTLDSYIEEKGLVRPEEKLRGPIKCRVVCESLTNTLHNVILPKFQWWQWDGSDVPGGQKGQWGLVPRDCLVGGSWERSWSEKYRTLRILYRDPFHDNEVMGESSIQFTSRDQDPSDFASGNFHIVLHDEPPTYAIWRENQARTMAVRGRMFVAMTWPDDPSIPVDWLFDEIYEPAMAVPKTKNIEWINIFTLDNPFIDQSAIQEQMRQWTAEVINVRIKGQPIRFSNRVHDLFTDQEQDWCFNCGKPAPVGSDRKCGNCQSSTTTRYCHVGDVPPNSSWPCVWLLDPHPRKPHMFSWWQVSPSDDLCQIAEGECPGDPTDVREMCDEMEERMGVRVTHRFIDPNMGRSPASARRGITWQDEFEQAGLICDLADDSDVGRKRIDEYLRPDPNTLEPRIKIDRRCEKTIFQMKRYIWDDYKIALDKAQKQTPKDKNDDYPTLMKYLLNANPDFNRFRVGAAFIRRMQASPERHAARMMR